MYNADGYWCKREAEAEQQTLAKRPTWSTWLIFAGVSLLLVVISFLYPLTTYSLGAGTTTPVFIPVITLLFILSSYLTIRRSAQHH